LTSVQSTKNSSFCCGSGVGLWRHSDLILLCGSALRTSWDEGQRRLLHSLGLYCRLASSGRVDTCLYRPISFVSYRCRVSDWLGHAIKTLRKPMNVTTQRRLNRDQLRRLN